MQFFPTGGNEGVSSSCHTSGSHWAWFTLSVIPDSSPSPASRTRVEAAGYAGWRNRRCAASSPARARFDSSLFAVSVSLLRSVFVDSSSVRKSFEYSFVMAVGGALFGGGRAASSSKYLVEFRAGKMTLGTDKMVTPDKRKGTVMIQQVSQANCLHEYVQYERWSHPMDRAHHI